MSEQNTEKRQVDIEQLLAEGVTVQIRPNGYSMYPMFLPGRDEALIAPAEPDKLKRGDVALYRRDGSILVLHRIWKRKQDGFYFVGDNQAEVEGPLRPDQVKGILTAFIRKGRKISVHNPIYRLAAGIWLFLRPVRNPVKTLLARMKRLIKPPK